MSVSDYGEGQMLALLPGTSYLKVHIGSAGEAGTTNAAVNTVRASCTLAAASGGSRTTSTDAAWSTSDVSATETYTAVSVWDAATNGNCWYTGNLTAPVAVTAGNTFTIPAGSLILALD